MNDVTVCAQYFCLISSIICVAVLLKVSSLLRVFIVATEGLGNDLVWGITCFGRPMPHPQNARIPCIAFSVYFSGPVRRLFHALLDPLPHVVRARAVWRRGRLVETARLNVLQLCVVSFSSRYAASLAWSGGVDVDITRLGMATRWRWTCSRCEYSWTSSDDRSTSEYEHNVSGFELSA